MDVTSPCAKILHRGTRHYTEAGGSEPIRQYRVDYWIDAQQALEDLLRFWRSKFYFYGEWE